MPSLEEALKAMEEAHNAVVARIKSSGFSDEVAVAREYFIDGVQALLDKRVDDAIYLFRKAMEVLSRGR